MLITNCDATANLSETHQNQKRKERTEKVTTHSDCLKLFTTSSFLSHYFFTHDGVCQPWEKRNPPPTTASPAIISSSTEKNGSFSFHFFCRVLLQSVGISDLRAVGGADGSHVGYVASWTVCACCAGGVTLWPLVVCTGFTLNSSTDPKVCEESRHCQAGF